MPVQFQIQLKSEEGKRLRRTIKAKKTLSLDVQEKFLNYAHDVQIILRLSMFDNMIARSTHQTFVCFLKYGKTQIW